MLEVRGRLAVGDHDYLLRAGAVLGEHLLGHHQRVVHVRAEHGFIPADVGKLVRLQLAGVGGEPDEVEAVLRELRADEVVQGERDLLGRLE